MSTAAEVTLTIKVPVRDSWGDDCTIGQLRSQASDCAVRRIASLINQTDMKITGVVKVNAVCTEK